MVSQNVIPQEGFASLRQVLFKGGVFQWKRLENLIVLAKENVAKMSSNPALQVKDMSVYFHDNLYYLDTIWLLFQ